MAPPLQRSEQMQKKIMCRVVRDRWDENGERIRAGTEIELPVDEAMDGVEDGSLTRVKPAK